MTTHPSGILPGDGAFTRGRRSVVSRCIQHWTGASYSHALVFHGLLRVEGTVEVWRAGESRAGIHRGLAGPRVRDRYVDTAASRTDRRDLKVTRLWRNAEEQAATVAKSVEICERQLPYGWGTIIAIALRGLGVAVNAFGRGKICSEHSFEALAAGRPELVAYLADRPGLVDPGRLSEACDALSADDRGDPGSHAA